MCGPRRAAQSAVEVVAPAVERADQGGAALALGLDGDARAPVTADVVEGTNDAVGAAQNDRALAAEVEADVAARFRQVALMAGELRSEEHTSEFQSLMRISYAVFCLKKKKHR